MNNLQNRSGIVGASQATWPLGQTQFTVSYTPNRTIPVGNTLVVQDPGALHPEVASARIIRIDHLDADSISGAGSVPIALFARDSTRGQVRFGRILSSQPVTVTYEVSVAPTADRDFPTCLAPMDAALKEQVLGRSKTAVRRAAVAATKKRPGLLRRIARGVWRRLPGVAGVGAVNEYDLGEAVDAAVGAAMMDDAELGEWMGAFADELASALDEE